MKTYNIAYCNIDALKSWIKSIDFTLAKSALIQLFSGVDDYTLLQEISTYLQANIANLTIIGTSTAGEILEGEMRDETIVISLTLFEKTTLASCIFHSEDSYILGQKVAQAIVSQDTKAIIMFADGLTCNGEAILRGFTDKAGSEIVIAGGMAGDNSNFVKTFLLHNGNITKNAVVAVALNNEDLIVYNNYNLSWRAIGLPMKITKANKNHIIEINNRPSIEVYRDYLGEKVIQNLPESAIEFPLIFERNGIQIARDILASDNGSLIFAGEIPEGTEVYFGVASAAEFDKERQRIVKESSQVPIQTLFVYSCVTRKTFLDKELELEFKPLSNIAPLSGFFTYGELYYANKSCEMLNITTTILGVSESNEIKPFKPLKSTSKRVSLSTSALIHLVDKSINELKQESAQKQNSIAILGQYQNAMDQSYIISQTDTKGRITFVNDLFCKISGYTKEELIGKSHSFVRHEDMPSELFKDMWQTIHAKKVWRGIVKNKHKLGSSYYVNATVFPLLDKDDIIIGYVGIRDDITELVKAKEEALSAEKAKSAFLATMSHELRTPLNAVIGFSQILMNRSDMPIHTVKSFIEKIHLSGKHLLSLVNNILDFSKMEAQNMELKKQAVDLNYLIADSITLIETAASNKKIRINKENFIANTVFGDAQLLKQVLLNILSNAVKFTPEKTTITLTCKETESECIISICDEGVGLDQEQIKHLFKPFSQIKEHQNEAIKGTGLGLAISKKIIELHHGKIEVQSQVGQGSCFNIYLPKETK